MPNDVKAVVSVIVALVGYLFARWESANGRDDLYWLVLGTAVFMIVAMWVFPEAGGKKAGDKAPGEK